MSNLIKASNKNKLTIDTQLSPDEDPLPLGAPTFNSFEGHEEELSEAAHTYGIYTPRNLVQSLKSSASTLASRVFSPVSSQTVKQYFEEAAQFADDDQCKCSPPRSNNQFVEKTIGALTREIINDGHTMFIFYDDSMKRIFYYLYAKKIHLAARIYHEEDIFKKIELGEESKECQITAAFMRDRFDEFIPESEIGEQWQTMEAFDKLHPLRPNFDDPDEYYDIFQDGKHRPFRRNQVFGTCYIHAVATLLYYLLQRTDPTSTWVIDILRYIRNALDALELLRHILDKGNDSCKLMKKMFCLNDDDVGIIGSHVDDLVAKGSVIKCLKKYGPCLLSDLKTTNEFLDDPWALHSADSYNANDLSGDSHSMVVVGVWEPKDSTDTWFKLQNSHKDKQFTWMEAKYISKCGGVIRYVKKPIKKADVQTHECWYECGSTPVVAECASPLCLTSDRREHCLEK